MSYRKQVETTEELAAWYDNKYSEMGGCWVTPPSDCNQHLDDLGVPFDDSKWLLDVGCGGGHFLEQAAKRVTAFGLEISREAIEECKIRQQNVILGSIENETMWAYPLVKKMLALPHDDPPSFDYITSIGSLEHVIDLPQALANIRTMLKPDGKWYFYVPNEKWKHFDQPNERTMTDAEWVKTFMAGGLAMEDHRRWNDSTAFWGVKR